MAGPLTEVDTQMVEFARVFNGLPPDWQTMVRQQVEAHPEEILPALTAGAVTALPEGREFESYMAELATAGGFGAVDWEAVSFVVPSYWCEPTRPAPTDEIKFGFAGEASRTIEESFLITVAIEDANGTVVLEQTSKVDPTGTQQFEAYVTFSPEEGQVLLATGAYVVNASVNSAGGDQGSEAPPEGYRTPLAFSLQVGEYAHGDAGDNLRAQQLQQLASQLQDVADAQDLAQVLTDVHTELAELPAVPDDARSRLVTLADTARERGTFDRSQLPEAAATLGAIAQQVSIVGSSAPLPGAAPSAWEAYEAAAGVLRAYVQQFGSQIEVMLGLI